MTRYDRWSQLLPRGHFRVTRTTGLRATVRDMRGKTKRNAPCDPYHRGYFGWRRGWTCDWT